MKTKASLFLLLVPALSFTACSAHQHSFSEEWSFDSEYHWHDSTCGHEGETTGLAPHSFSDWEITSEASCTEDGLRKRTCTVCGYEDQEILHATGHSFGAWNYWNSEEHVRTCPSCGERETASHQWDEGTVTRKASCTEDGTILYTCTDCGGYRTETIQHAGHHYVLNAEGTAYVCSVCGDVMTSGYGPIDSGEDSPETHYEGTYEPMTYLFIGSSITNGYDPSKENPNADASHYSMADMFREDFLTVDYKIYDGELKNEQDVVMRKISAIEPNGDGTAGIYRCYKDTVTLNGDGTGSFNGTAIEYILSGGYILLKKPTGYIYDFSAKLNKGDTVYKYAKDGYTLSDLEDKYIADGTKVAPNTSYVHLMRLALQNLSSTSIDRVVIQLSTNDAGQYQTSAGASSGHIPYGTIDENVFDSSELDTNTSFGGLEWIIAKARETWNADVTFFTCHMSTSEYATYKDNGYDETKVVTNYSELYEGSLKIAAKWNTGLIDMWSDKDINIAIHEDAAVCLADSLHLHEMGYEKVLYPTFRRFMLRRSENA